MFNAASKPFYQMADRVLGSQFLQDIAEFFLNFQSMYAGFVERAEAVEQLLHDRRTTFAVVTTLEGAPLREAETFCRELSARGFDLGALVLNKVLPEYLLSPDGEHAADVFSPRQRRDRAGARGDGRAGPRRSDGDRARAAHPRRLVPQLRGGGASRIGVARGAHSARAARSRGRGERARVPGRHRRRARVGAHR